MRPAVDLLMRIPEFPVASVADLGAGAGNVTKLIKERWPDAVVVGVEGSAEMVAAGKNGSQWSAVAAITIIATMRCVQRRMKVL